MESGINKDPEARLLVQQEHGDLQGMGLERVGSLGSLAVHGGGTTEGQVCLVVPVTDGSSRPGVASLQPVDQTQTVFG